MRKALQFELLALRLEAYGPDSLDRRVVQTLSKSPLWLETRNLLRSHEIPEWEINSLMGWHPRGCACWKCVIALNHAVQMWITGKKQRRVSAHRLNGARSYARPHP